MLHDFLLSSLFLNHIIIYFRYILNHFLDKLKLNSKNFLSQQQHKQTNKVQVTVENSTDFCNAKRKWRFFSKREKREKKFLHPYYPELSSTVRVCMFVKCVYMRKAVVPKLLWCAEHVNFFSAPLSTKCCFVQRITNNLN